MGLAGNLNADNAVVRRAVESWLELGGRAVDAALMYYNDEGLRQGLETFYGSRKVPRGEVFVTTKIPPERMGFNQTLDAIREGQKILPPGRHRRVAVKIAGTHQQKRDFKVNQKTWVGHSSIFSSV